MRNVVLTGFMCTGKSTIGRALAKKMGYRFIDSDEYIVKKQNMTIDEIFEKFGEAEFRRIEQECIKEISEMTNCIVATGGGVVLNPENIANLKKNGVVFNLNASLETILSRANAIKKRPLIRNSTAEEIGERMRVRQPFYDNNHFKINIDGLGPMQICAIIIKSYRSFVR